MQGWDKRFGKTVETELDFLCSEQRHESVIPGDVSVCTMDPKHKSCAPAAHERGWGFLPEPDPQ